MATPRTVLRSLGVLAAASGLAGAGVASATTSEHAVDGYDVSVTFALEEGESADACGAALIPPAAVVGILAGLQGEGLEDIVGALANTDGVTLLTDGDSYTVSLDDEAPSGAVSASDVAGGAYALVTLCLSDPSDLDYDMVMVGSPLDIIGGLSSGNLLETGSALLQGGDEDGIGAILSSSLGGGDEE